MVSNYNKVKTDIMDIYDESFCPLVKTIKNGEVSAYDDSLDILKTQADNIKKDKFVLMVAGEASSGKSSFINAYLGKEILPMDIMQCTSAIVEIRYGEKFVLKATYANKSVDVVESEEKIKEFLAKHAAINSDYTSLPIALINGELIIPRKGNVLEAEIKDFIRANKGEDEFYETKVRKYISEQKANWESIVTKMEIEYPFEDADLKGIEIIDSPGVNAEGHVGDITNDYIERANAVMFLKPVVGSVIDTTSFKKFLKSKSMHRNKNALFLILTYAACITPDELTRVCDEAIKQFPNVSTKQIIPVDSKAEMYINKIKDCSVEELTAFVMEGARTNSIDSFLLMPWMISGGNKDTYIEKLSELSRFRNVDESLNMFAHKAQFLAISEFIARMIDVIEVIIAGLEEKKQLYKEKAQDPIELSHKINVLKEELETLTLKINKTVDEISTKYRKTGGIIDQKADEEISSYQASIEKITPSDDKSVEQLENMTFDKLDVLKKFEGELQKNIVAECDEALEALSDKASIQFKTLKPDITKDKIKKYASESKTSSDAQTTHVEPGGCFKQEKRYSVFSQSKYYGLIKGFIDKEIKTIKEEIVSDLKIFVGNTTKEYSKQLRDKAKIKRDDLDKIQQEKQTAEEMQALIASFDEQIKKLTPIKEKLSSMKGGIDKNVGQ